MRDVAAHGCKPYNLEIPQAGKATAQIRRAPLPWGSGHTLHLARRAPGLPGCFPSVLFHTKWYHIILEQQKRKAQPTPQALPFFSWI